MRTPALAISWAVWQRNRLGNILLLAAIPCCAVLYRAMALLLPDAGGGPANFLRELPLTYVPLAASLIWILVIFSFTETDATKGFSGLSVRLFTLPISTGTIATCLVVPGVLAISAVYLAWAKLVFAPVGVELALRWPLALLAAAMVSFQAVVWGLPSFPWLRAILIGIGGFALIPMMVWPYFPEGHWQRREVPLTWLAAGLLPVAYLAALAGAKAERGGGWRPWLGVRLLWRRFIDALPRRRKSFKSPAEAVAWREWRRKGFLLIGVLAVCATQAVCFFPIVAILDSAGPLPAVALVSTMIFPLVAASFAGAALAKFDGPNGLPISDVHATKPITNGDLVLIKLLVAARVTVFGWLLAMPCIVALGLWPRWRELWLLDNLFARLAPWFPADAYTTWLIAAVTGLTMLALTWHSMVQGLSLCLSGNHRRITLSSVGRAALFLAVLTAGSWLYHRPDVLQRLEHSLWAGLAVMFAWKIQRTIRSFVEARQRELLPARTTARLFGVWFGLAACLAVLTLLLWRHTPAPGTLVALAAVWLWPSDELPRCVINLAANRHR